MPTVVLIGVTIELLCSVVMAALWRQNRQVLPGLGYWALNYAFQCTGLVLILLRGTIPDLLSIGLPNLLFVLGMWLGYLGLEQFIGVHRPKTRHMLALGVFVVLHIMLVATGADINTRALNMSLGSLFVFVESALLLLVHTPSTLRACTRWVGRVLMACGLVYALRSAALYQQRFLDTYYFRSDWREAVFLVVVMVMFVLLTYAIGLMVNHRLLMRVGMEREKFARAFNASPQAVILSRLEDGLVMEVNQGFTRIFGIPSHEALGRTSTELRIWPNAEERTVVMDAVKKDRHVENLNATWRNRDGAPIHGLYSGAIIDLDGTTCLMSVVTDITTQLNQQHEREKLLAERENALAEIHVLSGLLPICASCKKIRDDQGYWNQLESYIQKHSNAEFTHGICPECMRHLYADYLDDPQPENPSA